MKTLINIGVQSLFGRSQISKNKKFPVNFPVNYKKQGKHTLGKRPAEVNEEISLIYGMVRGLSRKRLP